MNLSEGSLTALVLGGGAGRGEAAEVEEAWQAQVAVPRGQTQRGAGQSGVSIWSRDPLQPITAHLTRNEATLP